MDIDCFVSGVHCDESLCGLASAGFTAYYRGLLKPLGELTKEEFAISSILNFSAQQLSNRTARNPVEHCIAHFTNTPEPFFSATVLKLVGYTEVHFLPVTPCDDSIFESIHRNLELNNSTEVRGPYLHRVVDLPAISGQFGLVHLIDVAEVPHLEQLALRLARFTDIIAAAESLALITQSLKPLGYTVLVERQIGSRHVAVYRRTPLPGPRNNLEV